MTTKKWRAGLSPRGALAPPNARPAKLLRPGNQLCFHRIPFDIPADAPKLIGIPDDPVEILLLPKFLSGSSQHPVGQVSGRTLNPSENLRQRNDWSTQQVDVIRHDHEGIEGTKTGCVCLAQLLLNHACNLFLPQIERATSRCVEKPIPGHKRFAGSDVFALEDTLRRKAPPKPPRDKCGHSWRIDMRQAPAITSHAIWCGGAAMILKQARGAEAPRGLKPALQ